MERDAIVYADLGGRPILVGRLWSHLRSGKETASFEYARSWLERRDRFALDPELPVGAGSFHTARPLFNAFTDPAPDRWGQTLLRRYERMRARKEARQPRTLFSFDYLLLVDDQTRLGALRFKQSADAPFLASMGKRVPPLIELPRLLAAAGRIADEKESDDDLDLVLAPGTSLGGARPKASVCESDGRLLVAKFPRSDDEWPVTRWEATLLTLATAAAIDVPAWRLELVQRKPVLMLRRFDRDSTQRIPFMSAMTALAATDGESRSYLEIVEALRRDGASVYRDLRQLYRRLVFNVLVSNTDDHLRNHGFLREPAGWRLAPAYDLNPIPVDVRPRVLALAIDEHDGTASLDTVLAVAPAFGLKLAEARRIVREVGRAVSGWRTAAAKRGLRARDIDRMASAFEHADLATAIRGAPG